MLLVVVEEERCRVTCMRGRRTGEALRDAAWVGGWRSMSKDVLGVDAVEWTGDGGPLFRRAGGKYPSVLRGMRRISVGKGK
jgi:hypothetical protein